MKKPSERLFARVLAERRCGQAKIKSALLDDRRLEIVARQHGIKKAKDSEFIAKLIRAFIHTLWEPWDRVFYDLQAALGK